MFQEPYVIVTQEELDSSAERVNNKQRRKKCVVKGRDSSAEDKNFETI